jgi:hypothetical protein
MKVDSRAAACFLLALSGWACGESPNVAGEWSGLVGPSHQDYLLLRVTQNGQVITGTACYVVLPLVSEGAVAFRSAPVTGMYPTVSVSAPDFNGWTFSGQFEDDGTISGNWRNSSTPPSPLTLKKGLPPSATGCVL